MNNIFHELVQQKMDRKEFLLYLGGILLGVIGLTAFMKNVTEAANKIQNKNTASNTATQRGGYGGK